MMFHDDVWARQVIETYHRGDYRQYERLISAGSGASPRVASHDGVGQEDSSQVRAVGLRIKGIVVLLQQIVRQTRIFAPRVATRPSR